MEFDKEMLPCRGLISGIQRALDELDYINYIVDRQGCAFKVIIHRHLKVQKNIEFEPINEPLNTYRLNNDSDCTKP